jgi:hypothetical protein
MFLAVPEETLARTASDRTVAFCRLTYYSKFPRIRKVYGCFLGQRKRQATMKIGRTYLTYAPMTPKPPVYPFDGPFHLGGSQKN